MVKMIEYLGHYVPLECCTINRFNEVDDCEMSCGDCYGECKSCITIKIFDEYATLTNQKHVK